MAGENAFSPAIARTGNRLAYARHTYDENIWRLDLTGDSKRPSENPVKLIASTWLDNSSRYSPDGKKIVFASDRSGSFEIWVCNSDGATQAQLTFLGGHAGTPRWAPDSRHVVFDSPVNGKAEIYVIDTEGCAPRRLATHPANDVTPSWSSDGRWIYLASDRSGRHEIWRTSSAGGRDGIARDRVRHRAQQVAAV